MAFVATYVRYLWQHVWYLCRKLYASKQHMATCRVHVALLTTTVCPDTVWKPVTLAMMMPTGMVLTPVTDVVAVSMKVTAMAASTLEVITGTAVATRTSRPAPATAAFAHNGAKAWLFLS